MAKDMHRAVPARAGEAEGPEGMPRLSDYYSAPAAQTVAFLRQARAAGKVARASGARPPSFDKNDAADTLERLDELDATLSRTVKLLGKEPPQVRQWVEQVTRDAFNKALNARGYGEESTPFARFDRFLRLSATDLLGKDKPRRERAQNLLRLALPWLVEKQNLKPEDALPPIGQAKRERTKTANLQRDMKTLLYRAPFTQLLNLSLVGAWYEKTLTEERQARRDAFTALSDARDREALLAAELKQVQIALHQIKEERADLAKRLEETDALLRGERELRVNDRRQSAAQSRGFLLERLAPLLRDARNALDFNTPHIAGSRQRLDMADEAIKREAQRLDD